MKGKMILVMLLGIMLISMVSSYDTLKQSNNYNLTISSNNATSCNVSYIQYPDGSNQVLNRALTKDSTTFYTIINSGNFTAIGTTCIGLSCTDGVTIETGSKCLDVTPSGFSNTLGFYIVIVVILGGLIVLGFASQEEWFIVLAGMGFIMMGLYSINYGVAGMKDMFMTWGLGLFEISVGTILSIKAGLSKVED